MSTGYQCQFLALRPIYSSTLQFRCSKHPSPCCCRRRQPRSQRTFHVHVPNSRQLCRCKIKGTNIAIPVAAMCNDATQAKSTAIPAPCPFLCRPITCYQRVSIQCSWTQKTTEAAHTPSITSNDKAYALTPTTGTTPARAAASPTINEHFSFHAREACSIHVNPPPPPWPQQ